jgi:hypothetical protein
MVDFLTGIVVEEVENSVCLIVRRVNGIAQTPTEVTQWGQRPGQILRIGHNL